MTDKNIVDDYYSKVPASSKDENTSSDKTVKVKRKIVLKKNPEKSIEKKVVDKKFTKKPTEANSTGFVKKPQQTKKTDFVQKIEVVKKATSSDTPFKRRKPGEEKSNSKLQMATDGSGGFSFKKKPGEEKTSSFTSGAEKKKAEAKNITWKSNKVAGAKSNEGNKQEGKKESNGKKLFGHQKTRGRFRSPAEKEFEFSKTNKLSKRKKEEKNIEDIQQNLTSRSGETVVIPDILSLKEFSEKIGVVLPKLMAEFMKNGMLLNINSQIDFDTASIISEAFDIKVERDNSEGVKVEDILTGDLSNLLQEDDDSKLVDRSPVISIMGHVDHGKTSLLDHIRKSKVTAGEAGGITQSIGAYQVDHEGKKITFLDTPGHEAFTVMRARGAKSTDIAILVVAADEGVKPQTIESINHAKEANIPVVVAINKMDKEGANPDHVKGQLSEHGLTPEDWGGDTPMVPVSAHSGFGIDDLLEIILLVAEMKELKANPNRKAIATVIESHLDVKLGPVATVLLNTGTLNKGENIVCQESYGKVKILKNHIGKNILLAGPSQPVLIVGLDKVVEGGDILQVVSSPEQARQKAIEYKEIIARNKVKSASGLDLLMSKIKAGNLKQLKVIVKADTNGALEAIKGSLAKLSTDETSVSVIHSGVGSINEGDILMGQGSQAILIGFSVDVLPATKQILNDSGVEYIKSDIIYHITERIEKIVTGMLDPKEVETILGKAKVGGIFYTSKEFMILGLQLHPDNLIQNKAQIRVIRKKKMVGHGKIESLKQGTLEVKELEGPIECGIKFKGDIQVEEGDDLEVYKIEIQK
ncbi:MAG: translation initiation factor IF-2 [Candidatus Gracilibacteria bacterium]|nr:translation initiation factor IF-2 [Candidatus Gracilibacteria bacterium]